jgi:hypothetical protein
MRQVRHSYVKGDFKHIRNINQNMINIRLDYEFKGIKSEVPAQFQSSLGRSVGPQ